MNRYVKRWIECICWRSLTLSLLLIFSSTLHAENLTQQEKLLRAAFLYNFAKFTTWPVEPKEELSVCLFGENILGEAFQSIEGKIVEGAKIRTSVVSRNAEIHGCHLIYFPFDSAGAIRKTLLEAEKNNILTIGDGDQFLKKGGVVSFLTVEGKVKFVVNMTQAEKNSLSISARMLRVAHKVESSDELSTSFLKAYASNYKKNILEVPERGNPHSLGIVLRRAPHSVS